MKKYFISSKKASGYILVLTLIMVSLSVAFLTSIVQKSISYQRQVYFNLNKEKARLLALGAVELALSQVSFNFNEPEKKSVSTNDQKKEFPKNADNKSQDNKEESKEQKSFEKEWFKQIAPIINKWQTIELPSETGLEAQIKLYISCEQGKINLNYIAKQIEIKEKRQQQIKPKEEDSAIAISAEGKVEKIESDTQNQEKSQEKKVEGLKEPKTFITSINSLIEKKLKINIINNIKDITKEIKRPIEDPTDLLKIKQFNIFKNNIFVNLTNETKEKKSKEEPIYLMDLFTASSNFAKINPWLLSKSLSKILELKTDQVNMQELVSKFKPNTNWDQDWDKIFAPIYGKSFNSFDKEITNLFAYNFDPSAFSVVVYIALGNTRVRLNALLKRDNTNQTGSKNIKFKIAKIYWF